MARLVLDTNSLIQCVSRRSAYHELWLSLFDGRNTLCVTNEIIEECAEILERYTTPLFASLVLDSITGSSHIQFITPHYRFNLITTDPDDNKFVDCAVAANAKYIVTEDHHFDILNTIDFPKVEIIKLDDAMKML